MSNFKVIIADDESLTRERIANLLDGYEGFELVKKTSNGQEALDAIKLYKPDVVFLDIKMPILNGFEVVQQLDSWSDGQRTCFGTRINPNQTWDVYVQNTVNRGLHGPHTNTNPNTQACDSRWKT